MPKDGDRNVSGTSCLGIVTCPSAPSHDCFLFIWAKSMKIQRMDVMLDPSNLCAELLLFLKVVEELKFFVGITLLSFFSI